MIVKPIKQLGTGISIAAIGLLSLTACNEPGSTQATNSTAPDPSQTVTQSPSSAAPATSGTQPSQNTDIDDLAEQVEDSLETDQTLRSFDLDADDEGSSIVLTGLVQNESQKTQAEEIARQISPNVTIDNRIRIQ